MSIWLLYLMTRTEALAEFLKAIPAGVSIVGLFAVPAFFLFQDEMKNDTVAWIKAWTKRIVILALVAGLVSTLLPTRKDWYLIVGGYYVTHIEGIDQLPQNMVGAMNEFLKEYGQEPEQKTKGHGA